MLDKIKSYFRGSVAQQPTHEQYFPVGYGKRITVDANGDLVYATCLEILAKNVAQTRWGLYGPDNRGVDALMQQYNRALNLQPFPGINAYDFWRWMEIQRLGYGNAYAHIRLDDKLALQHLVPLDAAQVKVYWDNANILDGKRKIVYEYIDPVTQRTYTLLPEEVFHVKAFSANGITGRRAIDVLRQTLEGSAEVESALRTATENGFGGTLILTYTSDLSDTKKRALQEQVKELLANSNATILPLPVGMSVQNITNDIKSYYETLKSSNAQAVSAFFGIPLAMLNIGGGAGMATFSTNQMTQFYNGTIAPIINQYATEMTVKLLTLRQQSKGYRFDTASDVFDALDAQARAQVLCAYTGAGILTKNEARRSLQYPLSESAGADDLITVGTGGTLGDNAGRNGGGDTTEGGN